MAESARLYWSLSILNMFAVRRDPRWQSGWKLRSPPPRITSELQQNYRTVSPENLLKTSCTEVLQLRIHRRSYVESGRKDGDGGQEGEGWPGTHVQAPTCSSRASRGTSQGQRSPPRSKGASAHAGLPTPEHQSQEEELTSHLAMTISRNSVLPARGLLGTQAPSKRISMQDLTCRQSY